MTTWESLLLQALAALMVTNILGGSELHIEGKHLAVIEPSGRPVNLLSALI